MKTDQEKTRSELIEELQSLRRERRDRESAPTTQSSIPREQLYDIVENVTDGILVLDSGGRIRFANPAACSLLGRSLSDLTGFEFGHVLQEGGIELVTLPAPRGVRVAEMRSSNITWCGERCTLASLRDVTEQKNALDTANRRERETNALLEGTKEILTGDNFQDVARALFDLCRGLVGARSGYVALLSDDGSENEVLFLEPGGLECTVDSSLPMPSRGLRGEAYASGKPAIDNDFANSKWMKFMPEGHVSLCNVMFAPLNVEGRTVGLMGLANKDGGFSEEDAQLAAAFSELAAIALRTSRDREALKNSERELQASNQQLRAANQQLRTREQELKVAARRWQTTFDAITDMVVVLSPDHAITEINRSGCLALGRERDEIIGGKCHELVHGSGGPPMACPCTKALLDREPSSTEYEQEGRHYQLSAWPVVDGSGNVVSLVHIVRDVTEAKQAEEERASLEEQFRQAQKMEAIGKLAGGVAHDFNNLLGGIMGNADLLKLKLGDNPDLVPYTEKILKSATSAGGLTRQLLSFARRGSVQLQPVSIHEIVEGVVDILRQTIDRRIKIVCDLTADETVVRGDTNQLTNALLNMGINARDAMPEGGTLTYATTAGRAGPEVASELDEGQYIVVKVTDTGTGMDAETLKRVFEPFYTTKGVGKGTGLGLSSAYGTVKQHGGHMTVVSKVGEGTAFTLYLPLDAEEEAPEHDRENTGVVSGTGRVMVVDDEQYVREYVVDALQGMGYRTVCFRDGVEAVEYFLAHHATISAVVLDLVMPRMNGLDCFRKLKQIDPDVRVIVSSGYSEETNRTAVMSEGALSFVSKPYKIGELSQAVAKVTRGELATDR